MSQKVHSSATKRDIPVLSDRRTTYAPVEQTRTSYSVAPAKPKK
jgi:hypothetical protein